jgi:hypothetical protein
MCSGPNWTGRTNGLLEGGLPKEQAFFTSAAFLSFAIF